MDDGKTMRIHLSDERPIIGTKKDFQDSVGRILERAELQLDPTTRKVFFPAKKMLQALDEDFRNLTYEKYLKENENIQEKMTREEFEKFRQEKIIENRQMIRDFDAGKITSTKILKSVGHIAMHAAMLPLFAVQYHRHQTAANMVEAVGEEVAFAIGAKAVGKVASKTPGVWKAPAVIVGSLAGGIGAVWAGHTFSEKMLDAKRHKWLTFQKSNYENKRSVVGHVVFGMGLSE